MYILNILNIMYWLTKYLQKKTQQYRGWNFVPADKYDAEV